MHPSIENIENLIGSVKDVAETKIELFKLRSAGKISSSLSSVVAVIMVMVFAGVALTILSFGLSFWINSLLESTFAGFFIVGGFYALVGLLVYVNRKNWVEQPLSNLFIDKIIK